MPSRPRPSGSWRGSRGCVRVRARAVLSSSPRTASAAKEFGSPIAASSCVRRSWRAPCPPAAPALRRWSSHRAALPEGSRRCGRRTGSSSPPRVPTGPPSAARSSGPTPYSTSACLASLPREANVAGGGRHDAKLRARARARVAGYTVGTASDLRREGAQPAGPLSEGGPAQVAKRPGRDGAEPGRFPRRSQASCSSFSFCLRNWSPIFSSASLSNSLRAQLKPVRSSSRT